MTLAGLRSRWRTPRSWAAARPAQSCRAICEGLILREAADAAQEEARFSPSTYSMEMNCSPSNFADVEDAADVGVGDLAGEADLVAEAFEPLFVGGEGLGRNLRATDWSRVRSSAR